MNVRAVAAADLHGRLPPIPPCDLLLLAGDVCPLADHSPAAQRAFLEGPFSEWLSTVPAGAIVGIAGNHDLLAARDPQQFVHLPWTYLCDGETTAAGLRIWGTPWALTYGDWAFMDRDDALRRRFTPIPEGLDVLLSHSPPAGVLDLAVRGVHAGSAELRRAVWRARPTVCVFGHIHEGHGEATLDGVRCLNVSLVDERYVERHAPVEFELQPRDLTS